MIIDVDDQCFSCGHVFYDGDTAWTRASGAFVWCNKCRGVGPEWRTIRVQVDPSPAVEYRPNAKRKHEYDGWGSKRINDVMGREIKDRETFTVPFTFGKAFNVILTERLREYGIHSEEFNPSNGITCEPDFKSIMDEIEADDEDLPI